MTHPTASLRDSLEAYTRPLQGIPTSEIWGPVIPRGLRMHLSSPGQAGAKGCTGQGASDKPSLTHCLILMLSASQEV